MKKLFHKLFGKFLRKLGYFNIHEKPSELAFTFNKDIYKITLLTVTVSIPEYEIAQKPSTVDIVKEQMSQELINLARKGIIFSNKEEYQVFMGKLLEAKLFIAIKQENGTKI